MNPEVPSMPDGTVAMNAPPPPSSNRRWSPRGARDAMQPSAAPEPPQPPRRPRGGGFLARLSAFLTLLVFVAAIGGGAVIFGRNVYNAPGPLAQDKIVFIPRNTGSSEIASILEQNSVISSAFYFEAAHILTGGSALRAGEYQFKQAASLKEVRETLISGRSIQHTITIPEGLTSEQIVQRIRENDVLEGEVRTIPREGALLPDTYRFERGTSREQMIARMEREQRRLLQEIWSRRSPDVPLKSPSDLVILASIVEKETGRADERARVASVFVNRLNRGMRLESDPTIIYGLVGGKGTLGRGILATEIRQPTPYNTYVINGLPPGPIANPGRASMEATANPSRTRDIFFVADGTGGHAFAETYEQHQRNVARWRQIEGGGAAAPAPPPPAAAPPPALRPGQRSDGGVPSATDPRQAVAQPGAQPALQPSLQPRVTAAPNAAPATMTAPVRAGVFSGLAPNSGGSTPPTGQGLSPPQFVIPQADLSFLAPGQPSTSVVGALADEAQLPRSSGDIESYPVAPGRRQDIQRSAQQAGAGSAVTGPVGVTMAIAPEGTPPGDVPAPAQRRPRAFDAVEGTARDPLRNKSFDLNTPKTVPTLR